ncbi:MAG: Plants and Prokaryotes Conserved domain [Bacillota bacterium]|jgi:predicted DNA-binding protein with PD1-like motif|nr:Plants and Prokaryotes Conserved domain [Bacillota bacterium]
MDLVKESGEFTLKRVVQLKIPIGVDLLQAIEEGLAKHGIDSAVILGGVGALRKAVFRNVRVMPPDFQVTDNERLYLVVEKPLELVSLTGWVARRREDERPEVHAHFSASYVEGDTVRTVGGHLTPGTETLVKVVVTLGVFEETQWARVDQPHGQWDLDLK